jgi:hypothetical protein
MKPSHHPKVSTDVSGEGEGETEAKAAEPPRRNRDTLRGGA